MNLSIYRFFILLGVINFALIFLILMSIYFIYESSSRLSSLESQRNLMQITVDELRQSSDDLTRFARLYAVSGDKQYKDSFNRVIDIRNGNAPRPKNYQQIYWDIFEPLRSQRHPDEKKQSFKNKIYMLPFDEYEKAKLKEAEDNSNKLAEIEVEAFSSMIGLFKDKKGNYSNYSKPDKERAVKMLFSKEYMLAKEKIMLPIDELFEHLKERIYSEVRKYEQRVDIYTNLLVVITFGSVIFYIASLLAIRKKYLLPIIYLTKVIKAFKNGSVLPKEKPFYSDEVGYMIKEFYSMSKKIKYDIELLHENEYEIKEYVKLIDQNIITSSTNLSGEITEVSEAFANISGYTKEELMGNKHSMVKHPDMPSSVYDELWDTILDNKTWRGEIKNRTKDGNYYWVNATIYPKYNINGDKIGYTAIRVDITDKKLVEELLLNSKESEKKIQDYVTLVDHNIITSSTDLSGRITYVSEAFENISGYTKEELIGNKHSMVKHPDMPASVYEELWDTITQNRTWNGEIKNRTKKGGFYWVNATIYPVFDSVGQKIGYTAIRIDITDKKRVEELMVIDALTNIYNRRHFNEMLPMMINMAKRDKTYVSFLIMDIDFFKQYNDIYGHQEGDNALIAVAKSIKESTKRASDMCFRLGGEEFGVVFKGLDPKKANELANTIRENIQSLEIVHDGSKVDKYLTVSIGLVTKDTDKEIDKDVLYKEADELLYKAKEGGRNRVETILS